ncbi:hypothetical protein EO087_02210 [Dyella sp. M7H15-1]|uniref:hypothetical protein n=1 Tax=Dyella sp. M7H15-1 TaxID=2501295 RepID=UPI001004D690|nr:hypothetical protein [Dyella sp. M7H15-1]QAU22951.1 hypothetical protein EO087_02210 [Dyella sp. M7H15-1]
MLARSWLSPAATRSKRHLDEAETAASTLAEWEAVACPAPSEDALRHAREQLATLCAERDTLDNRLKALRETQRQANHADESTAKARLAHEAVAAWVAIADALAPDGMPGEILGEALGPLNARLMKSSDITEWSTVKVTSDMQVLAGERSYGLLSESEQCRVDAMLAEAIAHLSGLRLLVLDRFDVLDLHGRGDLLVWLEAIAGEIDTALIFGTLKSLPSHLPSVVAAHWLDNGTLTQLKEADSCIHP